MPLKIRLALAGSAALLAAAVLVHLRARAPTSESPVLPQVEPRASEAAPGGAELVTAAQDPATEAARRSLVEDEPAAVAAAGVPGAHVLRVVLEGIDAEEAPAVEVTVSGVADRGGWLPRATDSWPCRGMTSEFDLDPLLARVDPSAEQLKVEVEHPHHLREWAWIPRSGGVEQPDGTTIHEVRVRLAPPAYWPEFTLAVRDARTRAHLEDVELRIMPGAWGASWGRNPARALLGDGLQSPIAMMGGRKAGEPEVTTVGMALAPPAGEAPDLVELAARQAPERGVIVSARAPGYAWASTVFDLSRAEEQEILLEPDCALDVQLANARLERYAALDMVAVLCVYELRENGFSYIRFEQLDEKLLTEGLALEGLLPGEYAVAVELAGGAWPKRPVLAREELHLAVGETRAIEVTLADPPAPLALTTLGGVVSFPAHGDPQDVRLELYLAGKHEWFGPRARYQLRPDHELSLADMERVGGELPSWSFHLEGLPAGLYQVQLWPFLKSWMVEVPAGGRDDVELVLPELAEVLLETVDAQTGERIPIDQIYYRNEEVLARRVQIDRRRARLEEPGRFRFWAAPGPALLYPHPIPNGLLYGKRSKTLELVGGLQTVRFEFEPVYAFHVGFREGGVPLDRFDELPGDLYGVIRDHLRPVDHDGRVTEIDMTRQDLEDSGMALRVEVSAPGTYEVRFEDVGADRFLPIPPRHVDVRAGETAQVIVELRRR